MFPALEVQQKLAPYAALTLEQAQATSDYLALLARWNARINLTAVRHPEEMLTRHFGESFFAAAHLLQPASAFPVIDVGSGAGFPGLPLKLYAPAIQLTLVESHNKKATFLREVARSLSLQAVTVVAARAETLAATAALVTLRAVEKFETALPVAGRLVAPGGTLGLLISEAQTAPARQLLPGFDWRPAVSIPNSGSRVLLAGVNLAR